MADTQTAAARIGIGSGVIVDHPDYLGHVLIVQKMPNGSRASMPS